GVHVMAVHLHRDPAPVRPLPGEITTRASPAPLVNEPLLQRARWDSPVDEPQPRPGLQPRPGTRIGKHQVAACSSGTPTSVEQTVDRTQITGPGPAQVQRRIEHCYPVLTIQVRECLTERHRQIGYREPAELESWHRRPVP